MDAAEESDRLRHTDAAKRFSGYGDKQAEGSSSLHLAAGKGNLHVVKVLLEDGKHDHLVNVKDANGWTPLNEAIKHGDMEMIRLMVDKGADFMTRTKGEYTTLFWAKKLLGKDHEVVEYLNSLGVPEQ
jgi:hypothetical protein